MEAYQISGRVGGRAFVRKKEEYSVGTQQSHQIIDSAVGHGTVQYGMEGRGAKKPPLSLGYSRFPSVERWWQPPLTDATFRMLLRNKA